MTDSWHSYPSIYALGHRYVGDLLLDPILVEEKVDGSQFSFGKFPGSGLKCRSKGAEIYLDAPPKMFDLAVETVKSLEPLLKEDWTYRGEFLAKPKHNVLAYSRVPKGNIILFDINTDNETYLTYEDKQEEAARLDLELVPRLFNGLLADLEVFKALLETESILGGQKVEGVVIKNYARFGLDKKALMGKFVSEAFKEKHQKDWKTDNPTSIDVIQALIATYRVPARWAKAVQHLKEAGLLEQSHRDIGSLIKEAKADIVKECGDEIKDTLYNWAIERILRGATGGLPEYYKEELAKLQFEGMAVSGN